MVFQVPQFWDIAGDGFQILLCLLMLVFFFKNRAIQRKNAIHQSKGGSDQSFHAHIFSITVAQRLNQAFTNIIKTITAERNGFENLLGLNPTNHEDDDISMIRANTRLPGVTGNQQLGDDRIGRTGWHDNVRKLAAKGLTVRRISQELKISMSEVELILSLGRK